MSAVAQTQNLVDLPLSSKPERVKFWVKAFVFFHVAAITIWSIPAPPDSFVKKPQFQDNSVQNFSRSLNFEIRLFDQNYLKSSIVRLYLLPTGFWQYWDMFAPNPANTDMWCDAIVKYRNGQEKIYQYPRIYLLPIPEKYEKERYRKYYERAHLDSYSYVWPQFAQRIAHLMDNPKNPPVEVSLRRHWEAIAPPGKAQPKHYNSFVYFNYVVNQQTLKDQRSSVFDSN